MIDLKKLSPLISRLSSYDRSTFLDDLFAGLTVGTVLIPQAMAYALLAGMPPIYGLYAGFIPLLIYALLGSSTKLAIGPVAISSILVLGGVSQVAEPLSTEYVSLVLALAFYVGLFQMALGFLKMGVVANFLSHPVIAGFTSAAALIIIGTQLKDVFGISAPTFSHHLEVFRYVVSHLSGIHVLTLIISAVAIAMILLFKKYIPRLPGPFVIVVMGVITSYLFNWEAQGVSIVGDIPEGLPDFMVPNVSMSQLQLLLPTIFTVTIIGIVESIGIAKALQSKYQDHTVQPNTELIALGLSKIVGSFFGALPSSGSFSRSAINGAMGSKTTISSIVTFILMGLSLLFLMPLLYYLPKAVLAAIILMSVFGLFDFYEARNLWRTHRQDFAMMMITFGMTLVLGIETGVFIGVLFSILMVLYRSSKPHMVILGRIGDTEYYRNVDRYESTESFDEGVIIRYDDQLYFGNADFFKERILQIMDCQDCEIHYVIIAMQNVHSIDSTGIHKLRELDDYLKARDIELHLCGTIGPVRDQLHVSGLLNEPEKHHATIHGAVTYVKSKDPDRIKKRPIDPFQHN